MLFAIIFALGHDICSSQLLAVMAETVLAHFNHFFAQGNFFFNINILFVVTFPS
jgi:hypothetical protein